MIVVLDTDTLGMIGQSGEQFGVDSPIGAQALRLGCVPTPLRQLHLHTVVGAKRSSGLVSPHCRRSLAKPGTCPGGFCCIDASRLRA